MKRHVACSAPISSASGEWESTTPCASSTGLSRKDQVDAWGRAAFPSRVRRGADRESVVRTEVGHEKSSGPTPKRLNLIVRKGLEVMLSCAHGSGALLAPNCTSFLRELRAIQIRPHRIA